MKFVNGLVVNEANTFCINLPTYGKYRLRATSNVQLLILYSLSHIKSSFQKLLMTSLHDLRFSPPPNSKSRLRLYIRSCAICIPDTVRCILVLLAQFTSGCLQHCKGVKQQNIRCIASSLKFLWYGMEYGRKF